MDFLPGERLLFQTRGGLSLLAALLVANFGASGLHAQSLPPGATLPLQLVHSLNSEKDLPGKTFTTKTTQDIPLDGHQVIRKGAKVTGHLLVVQSLKKGEHESRLVLQFDVLQFSRRQIPGTLGLRAMASWLEIRDAETPSIPDETSSPSSWTTQQIGGDVVYRGGGLVTTRWGQPVGKPVNDGVMVRLVAPRDEALPKGLHCESSDAPHALGVFASTACGAYGFSRLIIEHDGFDEPKGKISLVSSSNAVKIGAGSQFLLQVLPAGPTTGTKIKIDIYD